MLSVKDLPPLLSVRMQAFSPEALRLLRQSKLLRPLMESQAIFCLTDECPIKQELIDLKKAEFLETNRLQNDENLENYFRRAGLDEGILRSNLRATLAVEGLILSQYSKRAEARFLTQKERLDEVIYDLIRVSDSDLAHDIYLRLEGGEESFRVLSNSFGEGPERSRDGRVGPVKVFQAHPSVVKKLISEEAGVLIPPFQINQWWLVLRIEEKRPAIFDEKMCQKLARDLFTEELDEVLTALIDSFIEAAPRLASSVEK